MCLTTLTMPNELVVQNIRRPGVGWVVSVLKGGVLDASRVRGDGGIIVVGTGPVRRRRCHSTLYMYVHQGGGTGVRRLGPEGRAK